MSTGSTSADTGRVSRPGDISVWDPLVRIFHWSLVAIIAVEFLGEDGDYLHRTLGYVALGLVASVLSGVWSAANMHDSPISSDRLRPSLPI